MRHVHRLTRNVTWDEVTEKRVETERFAETERIIEKQIKNQSMLMVILAAMELCTTNSHLRLKMLTQFSTWRFWSVWRIMCVAWTGIVGGEAMDSPPRECPTHSALIVRECLPRNSITVLEHPPYSPDLAPCDFFLFPKCCGGGIWGMWQWLEVKLHWLLKGLREEEFQGSFQQWKRRWDKYIVSNGEYFEGDHIDVS